MTPSAGSRNTAEHTEFPDQSGAAESAAAAQRGCGACASSQQRRVSSARTTALAVQVSFEPSRVAVATLAAAYEHIVPRRHRSTALQVTVPAAPVSPRRLQSGEGGR